MSNMTKVLQNLAPGAKYVCVDNTIVQWDSDLPKPTDSEISAELLRLQELDVLNQYKQKRLAEYPLITDYIDGVVKGDQEQIQAYIDACLAVKAKYPKPEGV